MTERSGHWLVTGAGGMLGRDLVTVLGADHGRQVTAATRAELDLTDPTALRGRRHAATTSW